MKQGKPKRMPSESFKPMERKPKDLSYNRNHMLKDIHSRIKGLDNLSKVYNTLTTSGNGNKV